MQAIEFETTVEDRHITIPQQYTLDSKKVRVIILMDTPVVSPKSKLTDIIAEAQGKGCFKSMTEIDESIRHERNQWD